MTHPEPLRGARDGGCSRVLVVYVVYLCSLTETVGKVSSDVEMWWVTSRCKDDSKRNTLVWGLLSEVSQEKMGSLYN